MEDMSKIATSAGFISELEKEAVWQLGALRSTIRGIQRGANKFIPGAGDLLRGTINKYGPAAGEAGHNIIGTQIGKLTARFGTPAVKAGEEVAKKKGFFTPGRMLDGGALAATGGLLYAGNSAYKNPGDNYAASYGNAFGGGFQAQQ